MDHDLDFDSPEALLDPFGGSGAPDPVDEAFGAAAKGKEEEVDEGDEEEEEEEDEEGDPMTAMSPPRPQKAPEQQKQQQQAPPSSGQAMTSQDYATEMARIRKLPNEKERMQAMANLLTSKRRNGATSAAQKTPDQPQRAQPQQQQQQQQQTQQQAKKQEVSAFPSPQDLSDMEAFVYWTTLVLVVHGQIEHPLFFNELNIEGLSAEQWEQRKSRYKDIRMRAFRFLSRCVAMQGRLIAALEGVYKIRNPVLWKIIECMHACKFVVSSKPRRHVEGPNPVYCVWTGKPIPSEENVYACALTPSVSALYGENNIKKTMIANSQTQVLKGEVGFHVHKNYINVLKQWHTLLRFLDYLHLETEKEFNKVRAELTEGQIGWNSEAEKLWNDQFLGTSVGPGGDIGDNKGFPHMIRAMQSALTEGCKAVSSMGDFQAQFFILPVKPEATEKKTNQ